MKNLLQNAVNGESQRRHGNYKHKDHRHIKHPALSPGDPQEYRQRDEHQCRKQLIRRPKQRPDVHVPRAAEEIAEKERKQRRHMFIEDKRRKRRRLFPRIGKEQFLQGHTADARDRINGGHGQRRNAHGHNADRHVGGQAEHDKEVPDPTGEEGKRRPLRHDTACRRRADDDEGNDAQKGFDEHGTVPHAEHILLTGDGLGRSSGGNEAVKARHGAAGDGDKEDGEKRLPLDLKAHKSWKMNGRIGDEHPGDAAEDHAQEEKRAEIIPRLHHNPHGKDGGNEAIAEGHVAPLGRVQVDGPSDPHREHEKDEGEAHDKFSRFRRTAILHKEAEENGPGDVEHRN